MQIPLNRQMRPKSQILKDESNSPFVRGHDTAVPR